MLVEKRSPAFIYDLCAMGDEMHPPSPASLREGGVVHGLRKIGLSAPWGVPGRSSPGWVVFQECQVPVIVSIVVSVIVSVVGRRLSPLFYQDGQI